MVLGGFGRDDVAFCAFVVVVFIRLQTMAVAVVLMAVVVMMGHDLSDLCQQHQRKQAVSNLSCEVTKSLHEFASTHSVSTKVTANCFLGKVFRADPREMISSKTKRLLS